MLPEGEDINEWVAVNTVDFFNQVSDEENISLHQGCGSKYIEFGSEFLVRSLTFDPIRILILIQGYFTGIYFFKTNIKNNFRRQKMS